MLRPDDSKNILTAQDLAVFLKDMVHREDSDLNIDIDYEPGELYINCKEFNSGLSIKSDKFGVWVISELISQENDGVFTQSGNTHETEDTTTVLRAIGTWIADIEESKRSSG
jgi:hypothetical protein